MIKGNLYINGLFKEASNDAYFEVLNPYTLECIGHQANASEKDIETALEGSVKAFESWHKTTAYERAKYLRKLDQLMKENEEALASIMTLEQGKPLSEAITEVRYAASYVTWYAEEGIRVSGDIIEPSHTGFQYQVKHMPVGPVGIITPWNFPLAMFVRKMAPALAAGCTVVVKPAKQTPLTAVKFFELVHQAGFPEGVCQLLTGEASKIGNAMMANEKIRKISFTGSTEIGKKLMAESAKTLKKLSLELGGHAPFIVFEDADLEKAAQGAIDSKFRNCGQVCIATNRVLVHKSVEKAFTELLLNKVKNLKYGDGFTQVDMGPIIDQAGFMKIKGQVEDAIAKGATCIFGGHGSRALEGVGGYLMEPTILSNVTSEMVIAHEETFGPVLPIMTFQTDEEAMAIANNTPYGLASYFFTESLRRSIKIADALEYGMVGVNTGRISAAQAPFGGIKMSGFGREGGKYGIEDYLITKYIAIHY